MQTKKRILAKETRFFRKFHKFIAIPFVLFIFLLGITGLLLTWKSELKLTPPTSKSEFINQSLIPLSEIQSIATNYVASLQLSPIINRIDYRPSKGIAKIHFENHFTELQIDCHTGKIVSVKQRTDSIIEMIHDGSILDYLFNNKSENVKLIYSSATSIGLILLSISGFLLWLKPKQINSINKKNINRPIRNE